jgi:hypothetical protein
MSDLFIGWDVGAWNCDRNRESRDALCALELGESDPVLVGAPWRGNLRDLLVAHDGRDLVEALLRRLEVGADGARHVTIAIDTPLAWPRRMLELVTVGRSVAVPAGADQNPYLFRMQELALFGRAQRPLSMVRDMIGSQSTKGIHFLHRAHLPPTALGVWGLDSTTAIETYPAAARADLEVARLSASLLADLLGRETKARSDAWQGDVRDAITCALVAMLHRHSPERLEAPGPKAEPTEGWIWLPKADVITA